jgi:thiol-disulfide isomerase/thioredoxin
MKNFLKITYLLIILLITDTILSILISSSYGAFQQFIMKDFYGIRSLSEGALFLGVMRFIYYFVFMTFFFYWLSSKLNFGNKLLQLIILNCSIYVFISLIYGFVLKPKTKELFVNPIFYITILSTILSSILALYNKTKFTDKNFKEKEARNIHFLEQKRLLSYKNDHWYYGKVSGFQVSETYPKFDETIDLDSNSDFLFSTDYQELVIIKFYQNIKIDSTEYFISAKNAIPEIKALKSPSIRNHLIKYSVTDVNIRNSNYEIIYHEFSSIVTDPKIKEKLTTQFLVADALKPGSPSPKFDYENQKGGKTTLESLNGKYIYIYLWATWCGPCREQIPFLQKIEEQYKGKNIEFVSISIDAQKDQEKWSKFVTEKQLGGIQLLAENEWESQFLKAYGVFSVPTFILIDPAGNIVNAYAPKPSDDKLIDLFNSLKI